MAINDLDLASTDDTKETCAMPCAGRLGNIIAKSNRRPEWRNANADRSGRSAIILIGIGTGLVV